MTSRLRSPSLFWTLAGAFLIVLIAGTLLQVLVIGAVLRPLVERWTETQAELHARQAVQRISTLSSPTEDDIRDVLHALAFEPGPLFLIFRYSDGRVVTDRSMPHRFERGFRRHWDEILDGSGPPPAPPDSLRHRKGPGFARGEGFRPRALSRHPVDLESGESGEVIALALHGPRRFELFPAHVPRQLFLHLPIAVLVAAAAGLIMFRILLRRLRSLEDLAARVTNGDLDARVPDPGSDEIGRLGARLNRMTESLREARRYLEKSDGQRRQLLADISHELATPLTSIRGYTETLLEPQVKVSDEERADYLRNILDESKRMDLLIQELLDLTRLEAGTIALEKVRLDWTELCRNTLDRFKTRFQKAGLKIQWSGPAEPAWVHADGRRLEQALENLLVNAMRYVPTGGTVTLSLDPASPAARGRHRLSVSDDGPGFPSEDLPHVFDRFYRADAARTTPGSGLGLAIVKEIIRQHGGEVHAQNTDPSGAVIHVELPADTSN